MTRGRNSLTGKTFNPFEWKRRKDVPVRIGVTEETFMLTRPWTDAVVLTEGVINMTELEEILEEMERAIEEAERILYHSHLILIQGGKC